MYVDALCRGIDQLPKADLKIRDALQNEFYQKGIKILQEKLLKHDPDYYRKVDLNNPVRLIRALEVFKSTGKPYSSFLKNSVKRLPYTCVYIGLETDRVVLYERIHQRFNKMLQLGLLDEIKNLYHQDPKNIILNSTVGYQEFIPFIEGHCTLEVAVLQAQKNTRNYAKRQWTWFRKNKEIVWFEALDVDLKKKVREYLYKKMHLS